MSPFAIVPVEVCADDRLTKMQIRVLITLLTFRAKNTDLIWPKREQISERCGYKVTVISRVTKQLMDLGWLEKTGKGGFSKPCEYRITVPELVTVDEEEIALETGGNSDQTGNGNQFGNGNQTGQTTVTEPVQTTVTELVTRNKQTINIPISDQLRDTAKSGLDYSSWPEMPSEQTLSDWIKMRKRLKADVSQTVITRFSKEFEIALSHGVSVDECLAEAIERNWRGFKFEWYQNSTGGNPNANSQRSYSTPTDRADAAAQNAIGKAMSSF